MLPVSAAQTPSAHPYFTPEDIAILKTKAIGLRHLSSEQELIHERKHGARSGCAFNITFTRTEHDEQQPMIDKLESQGPESILNEYALAVKNAFQRSFNMDLSGSINPGHTTAKEITDKVAQSMRFMLIDYTNHSTPTDAHQYNGLGRYPKTYIDPERIKAELPRFNPSDITLHPETVLTYEQAQMLQEQIFDQFMHHLVTTLRANYPQFKEEDPERIALRRQIAMIMMRI